MHLSSILSSLTQCFRQWDFQLDFIIYCFKPFFIWLSYISWKKKTSVFDVLFLGNLCINFLNQHYLDYLLVWNYEDFYSSANFLLWLFAPLFHFSSCFSICFMDSCLHSLLRDPLHPERLFASCWALSADLCWENAKAAACGWYWSSAMEFSAWLGYTGSWTSGLQDFHCLSQYGQP